MLKLLLASLLVLSPPLLATAAPLRFAINDSWAMPIVHIERNRATKGILVDLQLRLAEKVNRPAKLVVLPHMRVARAMEAGDIDVRCYVTPDWLDDDPQRYAWTRPFMIQRDLLVSNRPGSQQLEDLHNERLGTVLGFTYPRLEALQSNGQVQREDARTQRQALLKLSANRYRYAISNGLTLSWFNRKRPPEKRLHIHSEVAQTPVACIVRQDPSLPVNDLIRAMEEMEQDGEFAAIIRRYL